MRSQPVLLLHPVNQAPPIRKKLVKVQSNKYAYIFSQRLLYVFEHNNATNDLPGYYAWYMLSIAKLQISILIVQQVIILYNKSIIYLLIVYVRETLKHLGRCTCAA